ncbi:MAG TPA: hypothetical protein VKV05_12045 [Terriglobales bacterium]|nr:hypothetical protein [Terriglobales bacterium]
MARKFKNCLRSLLAKFHLRAKTRPENLTATEWITRRITVADMMAWTPAFASYFNEVVCSGKSSALCALPRRAETEVMDDPATGDKIIRYRVESHDDEEEELRQPRLLRSESE